MGIDILCSGSGDGWIGPNSLSFGSEVLTLTGGNVKELVAAEALGCTTQVGSCQSPLVWGVNLPYEGEVELLEEDGGPFFIILGLPHTGGGNLGFEIECMGIIPVVDECTAPEESVGVGPESAGELKLEGSTLLAVDSAAITELVGLKRGNCSLGGSETAVLEGEGVVSLVGGGELTASSETSVS
jgi:hypothetical protein